jgi:DNA topoisomerase-1
MRTDSPNLSAEAVAEVRSLASKMDWPVPASARVWKSKEGAQESHEAIRPTHCELEEAGETEAEASLYRLIRLRALASQLDDAVYSVAKASLKSELDGKDVLFVAKGRKIKEQGWKVATGVDQTDEASEGKDGKESEDLDNPVPMLREGAVLDPTSAEVKTKKTSPPSRYTQASLIRELEKRGIGRPSTYAAIMGNISDKGYVSANKKRQLEATELGELVVSHLKNNFDFCDYEYTKKMESLLDEIADGKNSYLPVVSDAYKTLSVQLEQFLTLRGTRCPICGGLLSHYVRSGPSGYDFWVCDDKENCSGRFKNDGGKLGDRIVPVELSEHKCEVCGKQLRHLVKEGPGGYNFWACSDRNCNSTYKDDGGMPGELSARKPKPKVSGFCCPSCKSPLYRRRGFSEKTKRDYDFFACPNKTCNATYNSSNDKPLFKNYGNKSQK